MDPVSQDNTSILTLILNASLPVQLIMLILVVISVLSWAIIISKYLMLKRNLQKSKSFEDFFWSSDDLSSLHQEVSSSLDESGPLARIFNSGMHEFLKGHRTGNKTPEQLSETSARAMRSTFNRELDSMDSKLSFLASAGSVSPYIGLLGTVWGIMHSFIGLATNTQATLAAVAPGIAEALIATAIGLFAAIPAVLAYNYFSNSIDQLAGRFENFIDEFQNILQRQVR